jgi:hypothetical protein
MISFEHAARQMSGAFKMALDQEGWREALDRSVDGVFRSFAVIFFALPLVVLATLTAKNAAARLPDVENSFVASAPLAALVVGDIASFVIDWWASLILLLMLARATGAEKEAADLVVGFNWIQPVVIAAQLPAIALTAATGSRALGGVLVIPAIAFAILLLWGVVRRGLNAQPAPAGAIVGMLLAVGVVVDLLAAAAMRGLFQAQA